MLRGTVWIVVLRTFASSTTVLARFGRYFGEVEKRTEGERLEGVWDSGGGAAAP